MEERLMLIQEKNLSTNCRGFTLIELMLAMAISGIVLMAVFTIYKHQQQHYTAQLDVTEMQQNIRGALNFLARDIRMAGYDEFGTGTAKIVNAEPDLFYFTVDLNEDGDVDDTGEHIAYDLYTSGNGKSYLGRTTNSVAIAVTDMGGGHWEATGHQPAAENIDRLEFLYLDEDGSATTDENQVRTVVVSVLAKADQPDPRFTNTMSYSPASNLTRYVSPVSGITWDVNDKLRRRLQTLTVDCRNIGL